ncbi:glutathione S-transferase [Pelistega indica]|uniref:Glutathione S-transferase n=1 Tax=Pelistega indica TaxID=1414851 RepID=V8G7L3_9BURK|nr:MULTISPECIES: glutathione S-transferase [Pelistega]ETD71682.1 glutathione S-transferase [Pelistega indica]
MLKLHIGDKKISSWSMRPWVLMKALDIPFEEIEHPYLEDNTTQKALWKTFSPTSQVPVLLDGDTLIWDSLAIVLYLAEDYPAIFPTDKVARAYAYSACTEMHAGFQQLRQQCNFSPVFVKSIIPDSLLKKELSRLDELWQQGLLHFKGPFLAGNTFTAADAYYTPVVLRLINYDLVSMMSLPAQQYIQLIHNHAAIRAWLGLQ